MPSEPPKPPGAWRFAWRRLRRAWQAGELRVLLLALAVAAAAAVAVGLFSDRISRALADGSAESLGADALLIGHDPLPPPAQAALQSAGLRSSAVVSFTSVALDGEQTQLVSVQAVTAGYPLRGQLQLAQEPFGARQPASGIPARGEAWADPQLWTRLGLHGGERLQLGDLSLAVRAVIADEPGRSGAQIDFAPELLINAEDLPASGLLGAGSRVRYTVQLAGPAAALATARGLTLPPGTRYVDPRSANPEIRASLQRAQRFLNLAVLATLLLAAAAIALAARQHALRLRDEIALLKCLGAQGGFLRRTLFAQVLLLGLGGGGAGALLGGLIQALGAAVAAPLLGVALPAPQALPVWAALALLLPLLAGFALPPLLAAVATPPLQIFQRAAAPSRSWWPGLAAAVLAIAALAWLQAGEWPLAAIFLGGAAATALALAGAALLLLHLLGGLRQRAGLAWRFGLGNLVRRRAATVAQAVALGVALLALLLITVVRNDMLSSWQARLPPRTPNQFVINIQPDQVEPLRAFFRDQGLDAPTLWPMVRGRLTALNGRAVSADSFEDEQTRHWVNREFNVSWTEAFGDDNHLLQGQWWDASANGQPWLSLEDDAARRLKLKLGDTLTLDVAGTPVTLQVHNLRKVAWDSFRPNFFLVTPPGNFDHTDAVQWITSFYLPPQQRQTLPALIREFPNLTVIDLDATLAQVRGNLDRIVHALEFILLFALLAGVVVLLAVIEGSRLERARETAVLRALGASSRTIVAGLLAEYAALGLLAGSVAAAGAQALAWALAVNVFEIPYGFRPMLWLAGVLAGTCGVAAIGAGSLRSVLRTPPRRVLDSGA